MTRIIAIDPGVEHTGLVYMDEREIFCCKTLTHRDSIAQDGFTKAGKPRRLVDQRKLAARARSIACAVRDFVAANPHDAVVVEGFQQFTTGNRANADTFKTPYLCGYIARELDGENVIVQTSTEVLRGIDRAATVNAYPGGRGCTNDHVRAAACHGIYYLKGRKNG